MATVVADTNFLFSLFGDDTDTPAAEGRGESGPITNFSERSQPVRICKRDSYLGLLKADFAGRYSPVSGTVRDGFEKRNLRLASCDLTVVVGCWLKRLFYQQLRRDRIAAEPVHGPNG